MFAVGCVASGMSVFAKWLRANVELQFGIASLTKQTATPVDKVPERPQLSSALQVEWTSSRLPPAKRAKFEQHIADRTSRVDLPSRAEVGLYATIDIKLQRAKYQLKLASSALVIFAERGVSLTAEQRLLFNAQMGLNLLAFCDNDNTVLEVLSDWIKHQFNWVKIGRGYQARGPRRIGKTFVSTMRATIVASIVPKWSGCFANKSMHSGRQILSYLREFHSYLMNDPLKRIDTVQFGIQNGIAFVVQSHMQRAELRRQGLVPPIPERSGIPTDQALQVYNKVTSLPNSDQDGGAVRGQKPNHKVSVCVFAG